MVKFVIMILASLALAGPGLLQEKAPSGGLLIDQTNAESAIALLGKPREDRLAELPVDKVGSWLEPASKQKQFRVLTFQDVKGFERIDLSFLNDKLVMLQYKLAQNIAAKDLRQIYRLSFFPILGEHDLDRGPAYYEKYEGTIEVAEFPATYYLVAVSPNSLISARVFNDHAGPNIPTGGMIRRADTNRSGTQQGASDLLGKVTDIQIISRTLERK